MFMWNKNGASILIRETTRPVNNNKNENKAGWHFCVCVCVHIIISRDFLQTFWGVVMEPGTGKRRVMYIFFFLFSFLIALNLYFLYIFQESLLQSLPSLLCLVLFKYFHVFEESRLCTLKCLQLGPVLVLSSTDLIQNKYFRIEQN